MKVKTLIIAAVALAAAAAERPAVSVEGTVYSQYVWRGLVFTDGPVLQTSTTATYRRAHLNVWTNQDLTQANQRRGKVNELDFDAGYDQQLGERATLSGGVIRYTFPNTPWASTTELYSGISFGGWLHPSARGYFDVQSADGAYLTFDVSHAFALPKPSAKVAWSLELAGGAGWGSKSHNAYYFGTRQAALADLHPTAALPFTIGAKVRVTPRIGYATVLSDALRGAALNSTHGFFGGVSFAYTF